VDSATPPGDVSFLALWGKVKVTLTCHGSRVTTRRSRHVFSHDLIAVSMVRPSLQCHPPPIRGRGNAPAASSSCHAATRRWASHRPPNPSNLAGDEPDHRNPSLNSIVGRRRYCPHCPRPLLPIADHESHGRTTRKNC
jgi:hypothetical protein